MLYACVPYYTKIKSKRKFKIRNVKLSKISLVLLTSKYTRTRGLLVMTHRFLRFRVPVAASTSYGMFLREI